MCRSRMENCDGGLKDLKAFHLEKLRENKYNYDINKCSTPDKQCCDIAADGFLIHHPLAITNARITIYSFIKLVGPKQTYKRQRSI